jgi:hypothetical protein
MSDKEGTSRRLVCISLFIIAFGERKDRRSDRKRSHFVYVQKRFGNETNRIDFQRNLPNQRITVYHFC